MLEIFLLAFYIILIFYLLRKSAFFKNITGLSFHWIAGFFLLKFLVGIIISFLYMHYYDPKTADIYKYFNDGMYLYGILFDNPVDYLRIVTGIGITGEHVETYLNNMHYWFRPWESPLYNDNRVVIRFNAIIGILSFGNIHIHTLFSNLISFTGLVALYKFFLKHISKDKTSILKWGIFIFPSLLFWGSGILKEAILIGCFGVAIYTFDVILQTGKIQLKKLITLSICLWIMILLKPYILVLFLPCIAGFYIARNLNFYKTQLTYILMFIIILIPVLILHIFMPDYDPIWLIARKQNDLINLSLDVEAGSLLHTNYLKPEFFDLIINSPGAFLTVLLRPHIFEANNILTIFAAIENFIILILLILAIISANKITHQNSLTWLSIWFCLAGFTFIGLTAPVAGAIVRYKIIMLPFLWIVIINMIDLHSSRIFWK